MFDTATQISHVESIAAKLRAADGAFDSKVMSRWCKQHLTRVGELTLLDRLQLPVLFAVRLSATHTTSVVASGKGPDKRQAESSCLFEAYERWAAEQPISSTVQATAQELRSSWNELTLLHPPQLSEQTSIKWAFGYEVTTGGPCAAPEFVCKFPSYEHPLGPDYSVSTNGLAASTTWHRAATHAILELIERDAIFRLRPGSDRRIGRKALPEKVQALALQMERREVELSIHECSVIPGLSVVFIMSRDVATGWTSLHCHGAGAAFGVTEAAARALYETAQSRATMMSSLRDDLSAAVAQLDQLPLGMADQEFSKWFGEVNEDAAVSFAAPISSDGTLDDLVDILRRERPKLRIGIFTFDPCVQLPAVRAYSPDLLAHHERETRRLRRPDASRPPDKPHVST